MTIAAPLPPAAPPHHGPGRGVGAAASPHPPSPSGTTRQTMTETTAPSAPGPLGRINEIVEIIRGEFQDKAKQTAVGVVGCLARLSATVDGQLRTVVEVGDCERPDNWPHDGARLKDAASDAFKRCCMRGFGLGLHLYSGESFALFDALVKRDETAAE